MNRWQKSQKENSTINNFKNAKKLLNSIPQTDYGLLILRIGISFFMARHGYDKQQNLLADSTDFPDPLHIGGQLSLALRFFAEFFYSILLALGLFTRLALIPLIICMVVIVFVVSAKESLDDKEHALLYLVAYLVLFCTGAGKFSGDDLIARR
ncbi:DoxX family protein [Arcicella aquatica]|uniref:DoxX family protein n=1 Tax=Arcicella aquatica TaxID=217141 RepID=A0ABU5QPU5_9BACT|nr:DoxX family protein [Arcicella aquatica]MEA5258426.1 DoxX family protein [Arcicella aquatica]